ncbi:putative ATP-dependent DNA helicase Q1 [Montipora foliosa]|uniref:putative ATP-dependent DNA helicase Q1 n=1 Tax=Montipora foliosa TaxID=591990 RepID=UPI0035F13115
MASAIEASASFLHKAISFLSSKSSREIHLKEEQDIAIKSLLKEKDVFAMLPTGFGKSLVFQVFAVVRSLLSVESTSSNGSVLVVCPLKSIISDQIEEARLLGLTALEIEHPGIFENLPRLLDKLFTLAETVCADGF